MTQKLHIKKGDTVYVNAGESKGQQGRVLEILKKKNRAIVEGVNMISKHQKPNPKTGKPTRIGRKKNEEGKLVRYAKKSGEEIK